jgi:hypothetical protein
VFTFGPEWCSTSLRNGVRLRRNPQLARSAARALIRHYRNRFEGNALRRSTPFCGYARAGTIHQGAPHHLRRDRKEVGSVLPPNIVKIDYAQVRFAP